MALSRRSLIQGGIAGSVALGAALRSDSASATPTIPETFPFHGSHQPGVLRVPAPAATMATFDVLSTSVDDLRQLMVTITQRARLLSIGGRMTSDGPTAPEADSLVLGPDAPSGELTITIGLGASLFDQRFGLGPKMPKLLKPMPVFPDDAIVPDLTHGDVSLLIQASTTDVVHHALRDITRHTRAGMQPRWMISATNAPSRPDGAPRNLLGFKDGTANPDVNDANGMDQLVWVPHGGAEQAWAAGGTYQVVRIIRMLVEFWDRVSLKEQENMFGRRKASGAPLDGQVESDAPRYERDPGGTIIPLDAHIRLANPRTPDTANNRILRRGFTYDHGLDSNGQLDVGLLFTCYQQDLVRQFETVQRRLAGEPLVDYISPIGGGYFFVPPGVRDADDFIASGLFG